MGGLRKGLSKLHRKISKVADPIGDKVFGSKLSDKVEDFTSDNVWGGPIDPENPNPKLPKVLEMPDEEQLSQSAKRTRSRKRAASGRSSTVLSDGLGG